MKGFWEKGIFLTFPHEKATFQWSKVVSIYFYLLESNFNSNSFSCTKIKKIAMDNFFLLMHVILIHSNSPGSLWVLLLSFYVFLLLSFCHCVSMSLGTLSRRKKWFLSGVARNDFFYTYLNSPTVHCSKQSQTICSCLQKRNRWKSHLGRLFQKQQEFLNDNTDHIYKMNDLFKHFDLIIEGNKHNKWCSKQKTNTILSNFSVEGPLTPQGFGGVHIGVIKSKCTIS